MADTHTPTSRHVGVGLFDRQGIFRGNSADILRTMPYSGIQYLAYESLKVRRGHLVIVGNSTRPVHCHLL